MLNETDLNHYAARAQATILLEIDRLPPGPDRELSRKRVMDAIELLRRRVWDDMAKGNNHGIRAGN